jgi:RNA polymerase-binding transcription factor DksA
METTKYRQALEAEKARLEAELSTVANRNPQNPNEWDPIPEAHDDARSDENTNADALEDLVNGEAISRQLEVQLVEVEAALERIEKGTYGICEISGTQIEEDRLDANPAARTCKAHING